jgi:Fe-S oxidoreductase
MGAAVSTDMVDRQSRGILTDTDREYLRGKKEYDSRQGEHQRRNEIRDRVRRALLDFSLLADPELFPDSEIEEIRSARTGSDTDLNLLPGAGNTSMDPEIQAAVIEMFAFGLRMSWGLTELNFGQALRRFGERTEGIEVGEVNIELLDKEQLAKRAKEHMENGATLTDKEVRALLESGEVDPDTLASHLQDSDGSKE